MATVAGLLGNFGNFSMQKQNYQQRKVRVNTYKTGGKAFTKCKRSKSLKTRSNRLKSKNK